MTAHPSSAKSAKDDNSFINLDELLRDHEAAQAQARLARRQQIMQPKHKQPPLRLTRRGVFVVGLVWGFFLLSAINVIVAFIEAASR